MKQALLIALLAGGLVAGLMALRKPAAAKRERRVALAGGIYTVEEPPGIVGLVEWGDKPTFQLCDTGEILALEGGQETMFKLRLAHRSLTVQKGDGVVAELYGVADKVFDAQGVRSVHPRMEGECPAAVALR
ncbi:MAG: hypothetical protein SFV51_19755 [Bryobacteraceae bacterium]|nr:hypothetical protein [Bryobacteraceae bacterium]